MTDLPQSVTDYLLRVSASERSPAFLEVSPEGWLLGWGGRLERYGLDGLIRDTRVTEQVVTLEGLLPADESGLSLPCVSLEYGPPADIHIVRRDGRDWVLLLDASPFELRSRLPQQMANELLLRTGLAPGPPGREPADAAGVLSAVLRGLDLVVLERASDRTFTLVSGGAAWWFGLFPDSLPGLGGLRPQDRLQFLENFLVDAEGFWHRRADGSCLRSGWWHESGVLADDQWLEATALWVADRPVLVLTGPIAVHAERQALLQHGRSKSLEVSALTRAEAGLRTANEELEADIRQRAFALADVNRQLERELEERRAAEARIRLLAHSLESIAEMILVTDVEGRITFVNQAVLTCYGHSAEHLLGQQVACLWSAVAPPGLEQGILAAARYGNWTGEVACVRADGTEFYSALNTSPVTDERGCVVGLVWASRDLTGERQQMEALRHVEERLRQAQKMEAVGRLAGGVAHDFNNLLTVMTGYTEMALADLGPSGPATREIEEVRHACDRGAALTRQLLAFSRKQMLAPTIVDLNEVLASLSTLLRRLIGEDIQLDVVPAAAPAPVRADVAQIEQVVMNLAVNARDAMPRGGRLCIELGAVVLDEGRELPAGPYIQLSVRDTGAGMDEPTMHRIFEPFFTTKAEGRGTGLGLATVYGIVKQSGGDIVVESAPGHGTQFTVWLPQAHGEIPLVDVVEPGTVLRGSEVILLAEDEDAVRSFVKTLLELNGYVVLEARHGEDALRVSAQHPGGVHLLLSDTVMPGMSGTELREALASTQPSMKVLYMSGYPDDVTLRYQVEGRRAPFLQKPFPPQELIAKVREVLEGRGILRDASSGAL